MRADEVLQLGDCGYFNLLSLEGGVFLTVSDSSLARLACVIVYYGWLNIKGYYSLDFSLAGKHKQGCDHRGRSECAPAGFVCDQACKALLQVCPEYQRAPTCKMTGKCGPKL